MSGEITQALGLHLALFVSDQLPYLQHSKQVTVWMDLINNICLRYYSGMPKSHPKLGECQKPNDCWFGYQTFGFRSLGPFDANQTSLNKKKLLSFTVLYTNLFMYIKWSSLVKKVPILDIERPWGWSTERPITKRNHSYFGILIVRTIIAAEQKLNVRERNTFGFWHSTVHKTV